VNFSGRYRLAAAVLEGDPIPLTRVVHTAPRRIIAINDQNTSVRHCAGPRPIAIVDVKGEGLVTVLSGGREMRWNRWMANLWSARR
jgi:hypothetical protein